jgi:hypothetical protein
LPSAGSKLPPPSSVVLTSQLVFFGCICPCWVVPIRINCGGGGGAIYLFLERSFYVTDAHHMLPPEDGAEMNLQFITENTIATWKIVFEIQTVNPPVQC